MIILDDTSQDSIDASNNTIAISYPKMVVKFAGYSKLSDDDKPNSLFCSIPKKHTKEFVNGGHSIGSKKVDYLCFLYGSYKEARDLGIKKDKNITILEIHTDCTDREIDVYVNSEGKFFIEEATQDIISIL